MRQKQKKFQDTNEVEKEEKVEKSEKEYNY